MTALLLCRLVANWNILLSSKGFFIAEPLRSSGVIVSPVSSLLWAPPTPSLPSASSRKFITVLLTGGVNSSNEGLPSSYATLKIRAAPEQPRIALTPKTSLSAPVILRETTGFNSGDCLTAINYITRLNRVHLRYGSHLRSSCTLHGSLPPRAAKLLCSRTGVRKHPGLSPGGFLSIYTRLLAYRSATSCASVRPVTLPASCRSGI